jgi:hypothetical protein
MCGAKVGGKASGKRLGRVWVIRVVRALCNLLSLGGTSQREDLVMRSELVMLPSM